MQQADASISRLAPAGPGRAGPWLSTVESSSWCLEAPVAGHGMHLATSNEENPMLSSAGAAGGAGGPARRSPARTAHRKDWERVEESLWKGKDGSRTRVSQSTTCSSAQQRAGRRFTRTFARIALEQLLQLAAVHGVVFATCPGCCSSARAAGPPTSMYHRF